MPVTWVEVQFRGSYRTYYYKCSFGCKRGDYLIVRVPDGWFQVVKVTHVRRGKVPAQATKSILGKVKT